MPTKIPEQMRKLNIERDTDTADPLTRTEVDTLWAKGDPYMEWCGDDQDAKEGQVDAMLLAAMGSRAIEFEELPWDHWLVRGGKDMECHFPQIFSRDALWEYAKDEGLQPEFLFGVPQPGESFHGKRKGQFSESNMSDLLDFAQSYYEEHNGEAPSANFLYKEFAKPKRFSRDSMRIVIKEHFPLHLKS